MSATGAGAEVIEPWSALPEAVRAGITAMVQVSPSV
jgi:hypothetical protein